MDKKHHYQIEVQWTGNTGQGTTGYRDYDRSHVISVEGKSIIEGSSDPAFRGDKIKYNPEELFVASLSACHMLWYLHLCAEAGVIVTSYSDRATGIMEESTEDGGRFTEVTLFPSVTVKEKGMIEKANAIHEEANRRCFIANSVNFKVAHKVVCAVENDQAHHFR